MNPKAILLGTSTAALTLAACIVPPSMYEQASWGPPSNSWQASGRYRPAGGAQGAVAPEPESAPHLPESAPHATAGLENDPLLNADETRGVPASEPPLYAWDGGVVDGAPQGRVTTQEGTPRGLETPPAGRTHIIELYQSALDERDSLAEELERTRKNLEQTSTALEAKTMAANQLSAQVATLEAAQQDLRNENQTLAARLVQAQIRRLEAEKLLLETRIESERAKAEEAARAAAAQSRPGAKPRPSAKGEEERE